MNKRRKKIICQTANLLSQRLIKDSKDYKIDFSEENLGKLIYGGKPIVLEERSFISDTSIEERMNKLFPQKYEYSSQQEAITMFDRDKNVYVIIIDSTIQNISKNRYKFTIAHELGHIFLDHIPQDESGSFLCRDAKTALGDDPKEREANLFAAELLVPLYKLYQLFKDKTNSTEDRKVANLASRFGVSEVMMVYRLQALEKKLEQGGFDL